MRILVLSIDGTAHDLAMDFAYLGAEVRYFQYSDTQRDYHEAIGYTYSWRPEVKWADLVVCDSPYFSSRLIEIKDHPTTLYIDDGSSYELLNRLVRNLPVPAIDALCDAIQVHPPKRKWWRFWQRA